MSVGSPFPSVITARCDYCYERYEMAKRKDDHLGNAFCSTGCLRSYKLRYDIAVEEGLHRP